MIQYSHRTDTVIAFVYDVPPLIATIFHVIHAVLVQSNLQTLLASVPDGLSTGRRQRFWQTEDKLLLRFVSTVGFLIVVTKYLVDLSSPLSEKTTCYCLVLIFLCQDVKAKNYFFIKICFMQFSVLRTLQKCIVHYKFRSQSQSIGPNGCSVNESSFLICRMLF